jgi:hypothetical protein
VCRLCGFELPARADAIYERSTKTVRCVDCPTETAVDEVAAAELPPVDVLSREEAGIAGSSARREYERRRDRDEQHLR